MGRVGLRGAAIKSTRPPKELDFDDATPLFDDEDEEVLSAIDEGIRDAEGRRTIPMQEVRKLLPQWITASSSPNER